ncbi:MAG: hypothetical protein AB7K52_13405 [Phycisphaerales bacterium]
MNVRANIPADDALAALLEDLVEGRALAPSGQARVDAALAADPALAGRLSAMRAQRAVLVSLRHAPIQAPADLLARAQSALEREEREALLGLAASEHRTAGSIPASRVEFTGPGVLARLTPVVRVLRPIAAAAAIILVAGLSLWGVRTLVQRASDTLAKSSDPDVGPIEDHAITPELARNDLPAAPAPGETLAGTDAPGSPAEIDTPPAPTIVAAEHPFGMPLDRALALAGEGRLVIRIRAAEEGVALTILENMLARPRADRAVARVNDAWAGPMLAILSPRIEPDPLPDSIPPTTVAGSDPNAPGTAAPAHAPGNPLPSWRLAGAPYAVHFNPGERTLKALLGVLAPSGSGLRASLDEAPRSLKEELGADPDPAAILWWSNPTLWDARPSAAIVIETR